MKRRMLAFCLAFVMVLGMIPTFALAEESVASTEHLAYYAANVTVDDAINETDWYLYGKMTDSETGASRAFDVLWDQNTLYLAVKGAANDELVVESAEYDFYNSYGISGDAEIAIDMGNFGGAVTDYGRVIPLELSVLGDDGTSVWSGNVTLSSASRDQAITGWSQSYPASNATNLKTDILPDGGLNFSRKYGNGSNTTAYDAAIYKILNNGTYATSDNLEMTSMEFDFRCDSMPEYNSLSYLSGGYAARGFSMSYTDGVNNPETNRPDCVSFGITNANGTLYAMIGFGYTNKVAAVSTGKGLGETFHVQLITTADRAVQIYIDGQLLRTVEGGVINTYPLGGDNSASIPAIRLANYGYPGLDGMKADGSDDVDFTIWNVKMGETCGDSVLDPLNWDTIRKNNADPGSVESDLYLPTVLSNDRLGDIALSWESTDEAVVAWDGTVTPGVEDRTVTLTATAVSSGKTKTFEVTVPAKSIEATLVDEEITIDGELTEDAWKVAGSREFEISSGLEAGKLYAAWSANTLYLAAEANGATSVEVELGDQYFSFLVTDADDKDNNAVAVAKDGIVEIRIRLDAIGIVMEDYNEVYDFKLTLNDDKANTAATENSCINLVFSSRYFTSVKSTLDITGTDIAGCAGSYKAAENAWVQTSTGSVDYWIKTNVPAISDHNLDILAAIDLNIAALPEGDGAITGDFGAKGVHIWLSVLDKLTNEGKTTNGYYSFANIYNKGNGALAMKSRNGTVLDLGVNVGERFTLGYQWNSDNSVIVYINGNEVGTYESNVKYVTGAGANVLQVRTLSPVSGQQATTKIYSAVITASGSDYVKLEDELSMANVLDGVNLTDLTDDSVATLPGSWQTKLGLFELDWVSEDPSVVKLTENDDGTWKLTVKQPNKTVKSYVDLTMIANGRQFWSAEASVKGLSADAETTATTLRVPFTVAPMVIDGSTTDEGWSYNIKTIKSGVSTGRFGAQWNTDNLFLALDTRGNGVPAVTVNGKTLDMSKAAVSGNVYELAVALADLDVVLEDYEHELNATVTIGGATWEGKLVLTSTDWFITDGVDPRLVIPTKGSVKLGNDNPTAKQGYEDIGNGWRLFDLYDPAGNNPAKVRTYLLAWGRDGTDEDRAFYEPLNDRTQPTYCEFDFKAVSMPEYVAGNGTNGATDWSSIFACYGFTWQISAKADANKNSDSVIMGIYNTADGLVMAALRATDTVHIELGKQVGDQFRVSTRWELDGDLSIYVDGEFIDRVENVEANRNAYGDNSLIMNLIRSTTRATSGADSFDIEITNISLGKDRGSSIFEQLTLDDILGENKDPYAVTKDLVLVESLYDDQLDITANISWTISDPDVVAEDFSVTRPQAGGKLVKLTASWNGNTKTFEVYVKGLTYTSDTTVVIEDYNPAIGVGMLLDTYQFTLDDTNNSIILDLKEKQKVNFITLTDGDERNRLNESALVIWISDDGQTYTRVDSFKLKRDGKYTYLYDFEFEARYVKVHCTHYLGTDADFTGPLDQMLRAQWNESLDPSGSAFEMSTTKVISPVEGATLYDTVVEIAPSYAGLADRDRTDVRFVLDGEILYHYWDGESYQVRVPELGSKALTITVLYGCEDALDISNKEYVLETVYGTRETRVKAHEGRWVAEMPDNRIIAINGDWDASTEDGFLTYSFSHDGGLTWTDRVMIPETLEWLESPAGVTYDPNNGRIIVEGYQYVQFVANDMASSDCKLRFVYSDDMGKTWHRSPDISFDGEKATYVLSYSDPVIVSSYDGEGPNIDMVLNNGVQAGNDGTFCCRVAYTRDAGKTWTLGKDKIRYSSGQGIHVHEGGVSEGTILEDKNVPGKLVLYARCQYDSVDVFCKSYSYDYGLTWDTAAQLTQVYTVNTQPIFHEFNGAQLLFWGGNNVLGGNSYQRMPMNVAITYDSMETFVNIQDLYARTSLQGMTTATRNQIINQSIATVGDVATVVWDNNFKESLIMRVDNFTDWFYRTKGAYDSFENSTPKYEGWSTTAGTVISSDDQAVEGDYSMKISRAGAAVRSVPYVQSGSISMKLFLGEDKSFTMELESAYSPDYGRAAPVGLEVKNGVLTFLGYDTPTNFNFVDGWNDIVFTLNLDAATPSVDVTINGITAHAPVNADIGTYVCWFDVNAGAPLYIDMFHIEDNDIIEVPEAPVNPEVPAEPEKAAPIYSTSMTLGNDLSINFFVDELEVPGAGHYAEIVHGDKITQIPMSEWVLVEHDYGYLYRITYSGIAAKEMTDEIRITIRTHDGRALTETYTDSVRGYATRLFGYSNAFDTVLADMLNYGAAAQLQFNYKTDDLANSLMTDAQKDKASTSVSMADIRQTADGYLGTTLELENNILLNFFYSADYIGKTANVSYTDHYGVVHNYDVEVAASGSMGKVSVDKLVISDCSVKVTVTIDGISVVDSVESYCARMQEKLPLAEPLMKFAAAAKAFFAK